MADEKDTLEPNQVRLSDGRVVTMRETTGRDEIAVAAMLGKHFTPDGAGQMLFLKAMILRSIESIDGKPAWTGQLKFSDFQAFWASVTTKDGNKLTAKFQELNADPLEDKDESSDSSNLEVLES